MAELDLFFNLSGEPAIRTRKLLTEHLDKAIRNGDIRMNINAGENGERLEPASFTIDKRKYSIRLSDETAESVKVWIEPRESA